MKRRKRVLSIKIRSAALSAGAAAALPKDGNVVQMKKDAVQRERKEVPREGKEAEAHTDGDSINNFIFIQDFLK